MNEDYDLEEKAHDARRALERGRDEHLEQAQQMDDFLSLLGKVDELLAKIRRLQEEKEELQQQLDEEKDKNQTLEMKLVEMNKLSAGVAKKASESDLLSALQTYANRSKRKTADKRAFAKSAILEIAIANKLDLPEYLKTSIESLDDEQTDSKSMTVQGDFVVEKKVTHEIGKIEKGGIGVKVEAEE